MSYQTKASELEKLASDMVYGRNEVSHREILEADRKELFGQKSIYWGVKGKGVRHQEIHTIQQFPPPPFLQLNIKADLLLTTILFKCILTYLLQIQSYLLLFRFGTFDFFLATLAEVECGSAKTAHIPVQTSSAKETTGAKRS